MSGRKSKKLRRLVYGETSTRGVRIYEGHPTLRCRGDRRRYQDMKKLYRAGLLAL